MLTVDVNRKKTFPTFQKVFADVTSVMLPNMCPSQLLVARVVAVLAAPAAFTRVVLED